MTMSVKLDGILQAFETKSEYQLKKEPGHTYKNEKDVMQSISKFSSVIHAFALNIFYSHSSY